MITGPAFPRSRAAFCGCAVIAALGAPIASSQTRSDDVQSQSIEELKGIFLACDQAARNGLVATSDVFRCSIAYEELKKRAFGGNFDRLVAWYQASAPTRVSGQKR